MTCTHGAPHMIHDTGARCPWCGHTIATGEPRTALVAAVGEVAHPPVPAPAASSAPEVSGEREQPGGPPPVFSTSGAAHRSGGLDITRVGGTDRGHTTAAPEGFPGSLFDSGTPAALPHRHARNTDPLTSVEAAESVDDIARRNAHAAIMRALFEHGPQTDWQLGRRLGLIATSAGKRRGELRDMGLVADSGHRGPTETGPKRAIRWALTDAGSREVAA